MKTISLLAAVIFLASCKKNYDCACTTTFFTTSFGLPVQQTFISRTSKIDAKMKKKQAESVCAHEADNINTTLFNWYTYNGTIQTDDHFITSCTLK